MLFLLFVFLTNALPLPLPIPAPNLPSGLPLPESLVGVEVLIAGGSKGIGNATAWEFHNRGASVTITTRDLDAFNKSSVPFRVLQLEYGKDKSVEKLVDSYVKAVGRIPDLLVDAGLTAYVGNLLDFDRENMEYAMRMYATDPILLVREFLKYNNLSRPFNVSFALSTASYGAATTFISLYTAGKQLKKDFIRDFAVYEGPKYYPNVRLVGIACSNVNTTLYNSAYSPSVLKGDPLNTQLLPTLAFAARLQGNNPITVALAHLEALTTLTYDNSTLFLVPTSPRGRLTTEVLHSIYVQDNSTQFVKDTRDVYLSFGINITRLIE